MKMHIVTTKIILILGPVICLYEENRLLKRLFGPYRLDYKSGSNCDDDGREIFERGGIVRPECLSFVPDEDAEYQTMSIPKS